MPRRGKDNDGVEWLKVILVWAGALIAIAGAYVIYDRGRQNRIVEQAQVEATRIEHQTNRERAQRKAAEDLARQRHANQMLARERQRSEEARLKPDERCMGQRFAKQIDGDPKRWASDPSQDWKCRR